jgi:hypothetical protein
MAQTPHLFRLPNELKDEIIAYLRFPENIRLKISCTYLNNYIPKLTHEQLLEFEQSFFALRRNLYACRCCLRLRRARYFTVVMQQAKKMRGGAEASHRICHPCNTETGLVLLLEKTRVS